LAALVGLLVVGMLISTVAPVHYGLSKVAAPAPHAVDYSNIKVLGLSLFTKFLYPFELAALILLAAMIVAITLTFRGRRPGVKGLAPHKQIKADRRRVRMAKIKRGNK
jgi:NADH-quinone oxidoreductase subunit J